MKLCAQHDFRDRLRRIASPDTATTACAVMRDTRPMWSRAPVLLTNALDTWDFGPYCTAAVKGSDCFMGFNHPADVAILSSDNQRRTEVQQ